MARAGLDKDPRAVAAMFDGVARRYDLTNTVLSAGLDRRWRMLTRRALAPRPGELILDVAAGTGVSTEEFVRSGAVSVALDFSLAMLRAGNRSHLPRVAADALRMPFPDGTFDAVSISFGLRNLVDTDAGLREMARVTRRGGRLVVCEFSTPTWRPMRVAYQRYLIRALPLVASRVSSNPQAYHYLAESIIAWPSQYELAERIAAAGWQDIAWRNMTGGIVALHSAVKP